MDLPANATHSLAVSELEEFSTYMVQVAAMFTAFGHSPIVSAIDTFTTLSAGNTVHD